jgi:hypothetical protein
MDALYEAANQYWSYEDADPAVFDARMTGAEYSAQLCESLDQKTRALQELDAAQIDPDAPEKTHQIKRAIARARKCATCTQFENVFSAQAPRFARLFKALIVRKRLTFATLVPSAM